MVEPVGLVLDGRDEHARLVGHHEATRFLRTRALALAVAVAAAAAAAAVWCTSASGVRAQLTSHLSRAKSTEGSIDS